MRARMTLGLVAFLLTLVAVPNASAALRPDQQRWPKDFILLQNDGDQSRPLEGREGYSPYGKVRPESYCNRKCRAALVPCEGDNCVPEGMWPIGGPTLNFRLLGGRASDTINGGPGSDVIWGQFQPTNNPGTQRDTLSGGAGRDYMYDSRGFNRIDGGPGDDYIRMRLGRGVVDCGPGNDTVFVSLRTLRNSTFRSCERKLRRTPN